MSRLGQRTWPWITEFDVRPALNFAFPPAMLNRHDCSGALAIRAGCQGATHIEAVASAICSPALAHEYRRNVLRPSRRISSAND